MVGACKGTMTDAITITVTGSEYATEGSYTVRDFDTALMSMRTARGNRSGGYFKNWVTLEGAGHRLEMRVDVDAAGREGRTLVDILNRRADAVARPGNVRDYVQATMGDPDAVAAMYRDLANAAAGRVNVHARFCADFLGL